MANMLKTKMMLEIEELVNESEQKHRKPHALTQLTKVDKPEVGPRAAVTRREEPPGATRINQRAEAEAEVGLGANLSAILMGMKRVCLA